MLPDSWRDKNRGMLYFVNVSFQNRGMGGRDGNHFGEDDLFGLLKLGHHHVEVPACKRCQLCEVDVEIKLDGVARW